MQPPYRGRARRGLRGQEQLLGPAAAAVTQRAGQFEGERGAAGVPEEREGQVEDGTQRVGEHVDEWADLGERVLGDPVLPPRQLHGDELHV